MSNEIYELNKTRIYVWMKYNSVEHRTYKWNRFNVVSTKKYCWRKYNITTKTEYSTSSWVAGRTNDKAWDTIKSQVQSAMCGEGYTTSNGKFTLTGNTMDPPVLDENNPENSRICDTSRYKYWLANTNPVFIFRPYGGGISGVYWCRDGDRGMIYPEYIYKNDGEWERSSQAYEWSEITSQTTNIAGSLIGNVYSTSSSAYPTDGINGSYWYKRYSAGDTTEYSKGSANGSVTSEESDTYPTDGRHSDGYWYTANGYDSTYSQGTKVGTVNDKVETTYPNNARHTDGFWYVKLI